MKICLGLILFIATAAMAEVPVERVRDDAKTVDRIIEVGRDEVPVDILKRIATQDIDLLRGRHPDDTYEFARYDRLEASRSTESFSVQPTGPDRLTKIEKHGESIYRVILEVPPRRLLVAKNRPLFIDRVEIDYLPQAAGPTRTQTVKVGAPLEPGSARTIELEQIARQATVHVFVRAEKETGYGNLDVTLLQAKIFDNPDSPFAAAVTGAKAMLKALEANDLATARTMAQRIASDLPAQHAVDRPAERVVDVVAARPEAAAPEVLTELTQIEDLLTGTDAERRQAADRLHQLIRRMRSQ